MPNARTFGIEPPKWSSQSRLHFNERVVLEMERIFYRQYDAMKAAYLKYGRAPFTVPVPTEEDLANFQHPIIRKAMIAAHYKHGGPHEVYEFLRSMAHAARDQTQSLDRRLVDLGLSDPSTSSESLPVDTAELSFLGPSGTPGASGVS